MKYRLISITPFIVEYFSGHLSTIVEYTTVLTHQQLLAEHVDIFSNELNIMRVVSYGDEMLFMEGSNIIAHLN